MGPAGRFVASVMLGRAKTARKSAFWLASVIRRRPLSSFLASEATVLQRSPGQLRRKPDLLSATLPFGRICSDHQLEIRWDIENGWARPELVPQRDVPTHPASLALNHGVSCFEGMKAFAGEDGYVRLFRPDLNMSRLLRSVERLALPSFDAAELLQLLKRLITMDAAWTPRAPGSSLYIRPVCCATNGTIGFKVESAMITAVLAPGGPFFPTGLQPISLLVDETNIRAAPGGIGWCKAAGNYAPTLEPLRAAAEQYGAAQVLFCANGQVGECAAMNIFFLVQNASGDGCCKLLTPCLSDGTILPGVTRQSVIELATARHWQIAGDDARVRVDIIVHARINM